MSDVFASLAATLDAVWTCLEEAVDDPGSPARTPTLATLGKDGAPEARKVVLRATDRANATLTVHTDLRSAKASELVAEPRATLLFWDHTRALQIRVRAVAEVRSGADASKDWAAVPPKARENYGVAPRPGHEINHADDYALQPEPQNFAVLDFRMDEIETLHLGERHRRARFLRHDGFTGLWLAP